VVQVQCLLHQAQAATKVELHHTVAPHPIGKRFLGLISWDSVDEAMTSLWFMDALSSTCVLSGVELSPSSFKLTSPSLLPSISILVEPGKEA